MKRIVVGGQMEKQKIADLVSQIAGDQVSVEIKDDMDAALAIKQNEADYYLGACQTGGGAIAMAMAIVGSDKCETVSSPGKQPDEEEIKRAVETGKNVFGFAVDHITATVPIIMKYILD